MNSEWSGYVSRIGSNIDPSTHTIPVFVKVENNQNSPLYSGIFVNVEIYGSLIEEAVTIPRQAVYNGNQIYLIKEGKLEPREVKIVREEFNEVILAEGVFEGDTIIVDLMQGVVPGIPVIAR